LHPGTGLETVRAAVTGPDPESLNAAATPQRGAGAYGMPLAGLALLGFIARRRHRVPTRPTSHTAAVAANAPFPRGFSPGHRECL